MLNIPEEVKALFSSDKVHKNFHVHFPNGGCRDLNNEDIVSESVQFTESLCSQHYFKFGLAEASQIEFTAVGIPNVLGAVIDCAIEIDCTSLGAAWAEGNPVNDTLDWLEPQTCEYEGIVYYRVPYGEFIVDECPRNHGSMFQRKITAYTEQHFKNKQFAAGEFPYESMKVNPVAWLIANNLNTEDMEVGVRISPYPSSSANSLHMMLHASKINATSTYPALYSIDGGAEVHRNSIMNIYADGQAGKPPGVYAFRAEYNEHELDNKALDLYDLALQYMPSGNYIYDNLLTKAFNNPRENLAYSSGMFSPAITFTFYFSDESGNDTHRVSKQIFIRPNETYVFDLSDLDEFARTQVFFIGSPNKKFHVGYVTVAAQITMAWGRNPYWRGQRTADEWIYETIYGWNDIIGLPAGVNSVERDGDAVFYYKKIDEIPSLAINIKNTLNFSKRALGKYYTYENAISALDTAQGVMEILGQFLKFNRLGENSMFELSKNQSLIPISKSDWMEFWWDENSVDGIGTLKVKVYQDTEDGSEESEVEFSIGDGESVYVMQDNEVLMNLEDNDINNLKPIFDTYFSPNASVVNFTPVDLAMRGLPYLEDGDYIQLTAEDGTTVNTYILEQTISGIQHLTADVTSTNGELLEVIEDE